MRRGGAAVVVLLACFVPLVVCDRKYDIAMDIWSEVVGPIPCSAFELGDGDTADFGCEVCTCKDGYLECTKGTDCCMFAESDGSTGRAFVGEKFYNGCNRCRCGRGGVPRCTPRVCQDKCHYKNLDGHYGWLSNGAEVSGHIQICRCNDVI
eukprot:sb/3473449/